MAQESSSPQTTSLLKVIVYWAVVGVPLCWGIYKTVDKSVPLFRSTGAATVGIPVATPGTATPAPTAVGTPAELPATTRDASPFSTPEPSATVGPIVTPVPPAT